MAWAGAVVVVLATALFIKLGFDKGWWGPMAPSARCLLIAAFGALLMIGGEIALRRIGPVASVGLFGAGIATLYLDAFATFRFFDLLGREASFLLMAAVAIGGFAITLRTRFRTIGILSILGGYLTPVLLRGQSTHDLEFLAYLTMLLGISLGLSAIVPRPFRTLRYVALGLHGVVAIAWISAGGSGHPLLTVLFFSMWWTMVVGEALYAALRRQSSIGNVVVTLLSTAAMVTCVTHALSQTAIGSRWAGAFTAAAGVLGAAAALNFGPGLSALRTRPVMAIDKLCVALWAQLGILLAVAAAIQFAGYGQTIAWLAIGLAAIEIGRRLSSRGVDIFGLIVGALAMGRIALFDHRLVPLQTVLVQTEWIRINGAAVLAIAGILVTHLAAHRLSHRWRGGPAALAAIGTLFWVGLCAAACSDLAVTAGWLAGVAVLLGLDRIGRRQGYLPIALFLVAMIAGWWLVVDALGARLAPGWNAHESLIVFNGQMGLALAMAAIGGWAFLILRRRSAERANLTARSPGLLWQLVMAGAALLVLTALTFEADRAIARLASGRVIDWSPAHLRHLVSTTLWATGAAGIGLMASVLTRGSTGRGPSAPWLLSRIAWSLLMAMALKWLAIDTVYWTFLSAAARPGGLWTLANLQMIAAFTLAGAAMILRTVLPSASATDDSARLRADARWIPAAACVILLWGLTFELDRGLMQLDPMPAWLDAWPDWQLRVLGWSALWCLGGFLMMLLGRRPSRAMIGLTGWIIIVGACLAWLGGGTVAYRLIDAPSDVATIANVQFATGFFLLAMAMLAARKMRQPGLPERPPTAALEHRMVALVMAGTIGLWLGTLEIDRALYSSDAWLAGLSVYWGLYAVVIVGLGFVGRASGIRYAGLGLLTVTAIKVLFIDLRGADSMARVISFLACGLLLIATSVAYAKLAPRLLGRRELVHRETEETLRE
jgi:hypothetical protein